jgi:hypothetical protein
MSHTEKEIADKIDYVVNIIENRPDGHKFEPVLAALINEYEAMQTKKSLMSRAKSIAKAHKAKPTAPDNVNNLVYLASVSAVRHL